MTAADDAFMAMALGLSARGLGRTWPNPAVGCVLVVGGRVVGRGWTQPGGRPHAETEALRRAGSAATGATAYVTLEPCSNHGRTPPCSQALIRAGVTRVVVGCVDPDPRVNGGGLADLRAAGIEVVTGVLEQACLERHRGLYKRILDGRPAVTLKLAQSLDGRIALGNGQSKWLTGELARRHGHRLRAEHDAIMIGSGTAITDDPLLDCRIEGMAAASPVRIVLDRRGRLDAGCRLVQTAGQQALWIYGRGDTLSDHVEHRRFAGEPAELLADLAARGITRLLVEGGATLAAALLKADLVDRLELFTCPKILGADAVPAVGELGLQTLAETDRWRQIDSRRLGDDRLSVYHRQERN